MATRFFRQLYDQCNEGYITLWERQQKETYWFHVTEYKEAAETATYLSEMKRDVYFGVGVRKEKLSGKKRGSAEDILSIPGVWMDIDIKSEAHAQSALPASIEEAQQVIADFPIQPTLLVHSGHGLHAYWNYTKPKDAATVQQREECKNILADFQATIRSHALDYGWKLDNTADLARVLRVPGTMNYKGDPVGVTILNSSTYEAVEFQDFKEYCKSSSSKARKPHANTNGEFPPPSVQPIHEGCAWLKHCYEDASTLPEPEWYAMLSVLGRCENGEKLAHKWSQPYSGYTEKETNKKLAHALRDAGPATCKHISSLTTNIYCNGCTVQGTIKSPIMIGKRTETSLDTVFEDIPAKNLISPMKYDITADGIFQNTSNGSIQIFPVPVIISKRLKNIESNEEKLELSFYRDQKWNYIVTERSTAMNRSTVIRLADMGLPVTSENAKDLVRYLGAFDVANLDIPPIRSVNHLGWVDQQFNRFIPGVEDGIKLDVIKSMVRGYKTKGTLNEWLENMTPLFQFPIARFLLASSFTSPLLRIIGHRNFLVYPYGSTRGGKTAALKAALSIWGNPEEIMTTFNSTRNALERKVAFYSDLPMGIDEKQVIGDKQGFVESIAYMLGNGQSRGRATRDGKLQEELTWHNITIATGEDPLSTESSSGGVKSRTLEIYGKPIENEELASQMHLKTEEAYGVAGPEFIRKVIQQLKDKPNMFKNEFKVLQKELKKRCPENIDSHISSVATVLLADVYVNVWFLKKQGERAVSEALSLGEKMLSLLEKKIDTDDAQRAYEAFMSWYSVHQFYFGIESRDIYGWDEDKLLNVYPTQFKKAMSELGFNDLRIRKEWADRGWVEVKDESGKIRSSIKKWNPLSKKVERVISVNLEVS